MMFSTGNLIFFGESKNSERRGSGFSELPEGNCGHEEKGYRDEKEKQKGRKAIFQIKIRKRTEHGQKSENENERNLVRGPDRFHGKRNEEGNARKKNASEKAGEKDRKSVV